MQGVRSITWLLPVSTIGFLLFAGSAIIGAVTLNVPVWLLFAMALPAIPFVWLGLIIALFDLNRRPKTQISEEVRIVWFLMLGILNVFAFLPYWMFIIRRLPPPPEETSEATSSSQNDSADQHSETTSEVA